jgi:hypothetical protein
LVDKINTYDFETSTITSTSTKNILPKFISFIFAGNIKIGNYPTVDNNLNLMSYYDLNLKTNEFLTLTNENLAKVMYGYGDLNSYHIYIDNNIEVKYGFTHQPDFRDEYIRRDEIVDGEITYTFASVDSYGVLIRGWKYGLLSGIPTNTKMIFRRDKFGQLRDMLEQRLYTKTYNSETNIINTSAIKVTFVDSKGQITNPENTWSQNLSFEATSSLPYFDGVTRSCFRSGLLRFW